MNNPELRQTIAGAFVVRWCILVLIMTMIMVVLIMTMMMVVLMKIKRRFFTHSLFCPRGPAGPPEAVIILNDRPLLQKTLVHYCTTDPLKCKAHFKAEKKEKKMAYLLHISPFTHPTH